MDAQVSPGTQPKRKRLIGTVRAEAFIAVGLQRLELLEHFLHLRDGARAVDELTDLRVGALVGAVVRRVSSRVWGSSARRGIGREEEGG